MGGLWRLYYGGFFGQRILGKFGPVIFLMAILGVNLWFSSANPYTTLLAIPMSLLWWQGYLWGWDSFGAMLLRFNMYTVPIGMAWAVLEGPWHAIYAVAGLAGLAWAIGNRIQPTPWLGYTQWAEVIAGVAMVDSVFLISWLA